MRKCEELDKSMSNIGFEVEVFNDLPDKAKLIFFSLIEEMARKRNENLFDVVAWWCEDFDSCKSPIEKILWMAFNIVKTLRSDELPQSCMGFIVEPQYEIETDNHKYYVDFYIVLASLCNDVDVVVECDGHEFHQKTKEQVTHDNEREYEIKKAGYDVLRFSGSQIYNAPFKCANDIFDYLLSNVERGD